MILLIDNYDSFTFNIYDYICRVGEQALVVKNDEITIKQIRKLNFSKIVISPGPGNPDTAGISLSVVSELSNSYPILGICLGHQVIAQHYGYTISKAPVPMHGKIDSIYHDCNGIFNNANNPLSVVRYHSLIVCHKEDGPLLVTARNNEGLIMGLRHKELPIESVQFHPEAIKTESGLLLISNFINKSY
ncbi:anthranilate synthase component II [Photorhabdus tasmaniensis]|uniref:anthranilate synthase component II n=1 Tax=Photorhabdus tasmaniensis TaxID=1004159 RepID=UPI004041D115